MDSRISRKEIDNSGKIRWLDEIALTKRKKYEGRTLDKVEKWDLYVGKEIIFYDHGGLEALVKITSLPTYKNFVEAYHDLGEELIPGDHWSDNEVKSFYNKYYSDQQVEDAGGVVAIGVEVLTVDQL